MGKRRDLLLDFRKRQEQRAQTYTEFQVFFKKYTENGDGKTYQSLCKGITLKFQQIGKDILKVAHSRPLQTIS
jgi:hypothetical protein